jgi:hypothetical protein
MDHRLTTLEKAFHLARFGNCRNLDYLMRTLKSEGYDLAPLYGKALKKQLLELIEKQDER